MKLGIKRRVIYGTCLIMLAAGAIYMEMLVFLGQSQSVAFIEFAHYFTIVTVVFLAAFSIDLFLILKVQNQKK